MWGLPVDTGFIVCNDRTYPFFQTFLSQLGISLQPTDMSFSYTCRKTGLSYASSNLNAWFAQRRNLLKPNLWRLLVEIIRFNRRTQKRLAAGVLAERTLGEYVQREGFSVRLIEQYLIPMGAAIWSTGDDQMMDFPAESFARFLENHGLLTVTDQPQWYVVEGGSHTYVKAFLDTFKGKKIRGCSVSEIARTDAGVVVRSAAGTEELFDCVVIATHADEAYALLSDPSKDETRLLSPWEYAENYTVLHTDMSFLPSNRRAWASWNYVREAHGSSNKPVAVTYYMNRLQNLTAERTYCVTLNPGKTIPAHHVIREMHYKHPQYTFDALATQEDLANLNGANNTYFCGSYFGYGFHEDAVRSAVNVGSAFGVAL